MLSSFAIRNFKAFGQIQTIPLKPITLIFGPNSAGKSSIIHALLLARHVLDHGGDLNVFRTEVGGDSVDLGGFRQYVFRRNLNHTVEWRASLPVDALSDRMRQLISTKDVEVSVQWKQPLNDIGEPLEEPPQLVAMQFSMSGEMAFRLSRRPDQTLQIDRAAPRVLEKIADAILANHSIGPESTEVHRAALCQVLSDLAAEVRFAGLDFFPQSMMHRQRGRDELSGFGQMPVALSRGFQEEDITRTAQLFGPRLISELVTGLGEAFSNQLRRLTYLGPLRSYPARHLAFAQDHDRNWNAGGGYAWDVVRIDAAVRDAVNRWLTADFLKTKYRLEIRNLTALEALEEPLRDTLEEVKIGIVQEGDPTRSEYHDPEPPLWGIPDLDAEAERFVRELRRRAHETFQELVLMDIAQKTPVSHRDVGIGISQVLPVLVHAYADRGKIVTIEQPEIHLHPALQSELADVFIESALGKQGNMFVLETHSEHLILRLLRRIRETSSGQQTVGRFHVTPDDVSILFVLPTEQGSEVRQLRVDAKGRLLDAWPGGFFEESFNELF
jgi:hypothetical protein